jgi:hypothetical protein
MSPLVKRKSANKQTSKLGQQPHSDELGAPKSRPCTGIKNEDKMAGTKE